MCGGLPVAAKDSDNEATTPEAQAAIEPREEASAAGPAGPGVTKAEPKQQGGAPAGYQVQLPMFEGPLDLLLHLIQKHELDILNIPIAFISEKYFEYIKQMQELSIDLASEYLVMAATLVHIKSRSLLPPSPDDQDQLDPELEEDPRAELIRRLLAYQKYKLAAEQLGGRDVLGRDVFLRGAPMQADSEPAALVPPSLFQLMDAFRTLLERAKRLADHEIDFERISITDRIGQLSELLQSRGEVRFEDLFADQVTRADLIVTFLALLEMTRLRMTRLRQQSPLEPLFVELAIQDPAALGEALDELEARGAAVDDEVSGAPASVEEQGQLGEESDLQEGELAHDEGEAAESGEPRDDE
jgi:segregation and condensation protein A